MVLWGSFYSNHTMKAKEWVQILTPLSQAGEERTEEFLEQVELLAKECYAIVDARLGNLDRPDVQSRHGLGFVNRGSDERMAAAYREGLIKWDAVVHGVTQNLSSDEGALRFPLFRGGILAGRMGELESALSSNPTHRERIERDFRVLESVARGLGYLSDPIFVSLVDLFNRQIGNAALDSIDQLTEELLELQKLMNSGKMKTDRAMKLHMKLFHLRDKLHAALDRMSPDQKIQAYFLLGLKLSAG